MSFNKSRVMMQDEEDEQTTLKEPDWAYEDDPYGDSAKSIILAQQAYRRKDFRFIEKEGNNSRRIQNKAKAIYQNATQYNVDRNKSGQEMILENWAIECQKYVDFDCESQNSEDCQVEIDFPSCDDIMAIIDTEKQDGKMYFVVKLKFSKGQNYRFFLERVRGGGHDQPTISLMDRKDVYYLYKLEMTSQIRTFKIILQVDGQRVLETKPFNFNVERMQYDCGLSYDMDQKAKLQMSAFEGLVAASNFNIVDQIDFFEKSLQKFQDKTKSFLNQAIILDSIFDNFIRNQRNSQKFILLCQEIIKTPEDEDGKISLYRKQIIKKFSNYFMRFMLGFDLKVSEQRNLTVNKIHKIIETYLEINSIQLIIKQDLGLLKDLDKKQLNKKVPLCVCFLIENKKFDTAMKYIHNEIVFKLNILFENKALESLIDLIKESVEAFDECYVDLVTIFIYYYMKSANNFTSMHLISSLSKAFGADVKYHWFEPDQTDRFAIQKSYKIQKQQLIKQYDRQIASAIVIPPKNYQVFEKVCKLVKKNREHDYLKTIFQDQILLKSINDYADIMIRQIPIIAKVEELEIAIKIVSQFCLSDPQSHMGKLSTLSGRIIGSQNRSIPNEKKCQIIHKLVLNDLMKNGSSQKIDCITRICRDLADGLKRLTYKKAIQFFNQCLDQNVFSTVLIQDIYNRNLLKQVFSIHFNKQNTNDIQYEVGDYKNWHNNFKLKPFLNIYITEEVSKLICAKYKSKPRQRHLAIQKLIKIINQHVSNVSDRQILKAIAELDSFQLNQNSFENILKQNRNKLRILKKILQQNDDQQRNNLEILICEFRQKVQNEKISGDVLNRINFATQFEKNMIDSLFPPCGITKLIEEKVQITNSCIQKLGRFRAFLDCINKTYQIIDYTDILNRLQASQHKILTGEILYKAQVLQIIDKVDETVLQCYTFSSFFSGQNAKKITLSEAIKKCKFLQKRIIQNRDRVVNEYKNQRLTYQSVDFFKEEFEREKELRELFMMNVNQDQQNVADADMVRQLLKIFTLLKKIPQISKQIKGFQFFLGMDQTNKVNEIKNSLGLFSNYLSQISNKVPTTNISKLYLQYDKANKLLSYFKFSKSSSQCLSLDDTKSMNLMNFLYQLSLVSHQSLRQLVEIKPQLQNMKDKCDEDQDNFLVNYEDLQKTQTLINFIQTVLQTNRNNVRSLVSETYKFMAKYSRLKLSYEVFKKLKQLRVQFSQIHKGDQKILDKIRDILEECTIYLSFDSQTNLQISLKKGSSKEKIEEANSQQKSSKEKIEKVNSQQKNPDKFLTEEDIKKYKNQAIVFLTKKNDKQKTSDDLIKTQIYQKFLELMKKIDSIRQIWKDLQQWGYVIFQKLQNPQLRNPQQSSLVSKIKLTESAMDRQIYISKQKRQQLDNYLENMRSQCQKWIKSIKSLHEISPKATLLQGQAIRDFYEVLTYEQSNKKANFLHICSPQQIQKFRKEKEVYYKPDIESVISVIRQFLQFLLLKNKKEDIPDLKDFSESYIKMALLDQRQKDFVNGLIELDPQRIKRLDNTKILICVADTTLIDVKAFIETALRDQKNQYVIMKPQNLSNQLQRYIIDQIKQYQKNNKKITLKMCLIANSTFQTLYQFMVNTFPKKSIQERDRKEKQKALQSFIEQKTREVTIVKSSQPGFGKTQYIIEKSKNNKILFFPLSGAPTANDVMNRFKSICNKILEASMKEKKQSSLVIQIHHIDPSSYQFVNTFLQSLIIGRGIRHFGSFTQFLQNTKLFIEIQNIQSVRRFDPLTTFSFLRDIVSREGSKIIHEIKERPPINFGLCESAKMEYIIDHLDYYNNNKLHEDLEKLNIPRFSDYKPKGLDQAKKNRGSELMKIYFFDLMKSPTFYHFQYFCKLLFEACRAFSSSYGLSFQCLKQNYPPRDFKTLGLQTIRTDFFRVILKNCIEFIGRQVDYEQFNFTNGTKTQQALRQIPFLIIPNTDGQSFSFIYKEARNVPEAIRNFYISQSPDLLRRMYVVPLQKLFEQHSIKRLEQTNPKAFDQKIRQTLFNISGNRNYTINSDPNYVVNIDNFFKMCLITLRQRQNIPITIMGQAGTGKTALLKHISQKLYGHEFMTLNINAGTTEKDLRHFLKEVEDKYNILQKTPENKKKIWVFFDEFNTLKSVGLIKEIIIDKRFEGRQLPFLKDVVIMAACNPFRKLRRSEQIRTELSVLMENQRNANQQIQQQQQDDQNENLAFHVLPPPHSMIECMWNYGALQKYEYKKYIQRMISNVEYKRSETTDALLEIHEYLANTFDASFVSLRDIERFRTIYKFFSQKLPLAPHQKTTVYPTYNNKQERALIESFIFCYSLRLQNYKAKQHIYQIVERFLKLNKGYTQLVKETEQTDFYNRLKIDYKSIAANSAIKENVYCFFVSIYNKLPMIIVGPPGCSKSLAIRILTENMKGMNSEDKYLQEFKAIRPLNFQGSEVCSSGQVKKLFQEAISRSKRNQKENNLQSSLVVIVFDEIGLADKSKDNPLKVIHPYLQVSKELNLNNKAEQQQKKYAFIGISNTNLDISKMSRMLVLRRPSPSEDQLKNTAVGIGKSFQYGRYEKIQLMIQRISESFFRFVDQWHNLRGFKNFYSLRDFYSLIKDFLGICQQRQLNINDDRQLNNIFEYAVFKNLNGSNSSIEMFMKQFCEMSHQIYISGAVSQKYDVVQNILKSLQKQNVRFPLVIAEDQESLSYLINMLLSRFGQQAAYFERSPFINDKQNSRHIIGTTASIIKTLSKGEKLILNNVQTTIQTSLYDMLNKFYIVRGEQNYCQISDVEQGLTKKVPVNKEFNCICFLLVQNLGEIEAPFLSRFEKYKFSLDKLKDSDKIFRIGRQIQQFKKTVMQVCESKNMLHYKIQNFFQNCQQGVLKTLILRSFNEISAQKPKVQVESIIHQGEQHVKIERAVVQEVIYDMVMNSTQDFLMIYKYVLSKQPALQIYAKPINEALEKKKTFDIENATNVILFTTEKKIVYDCCGDEEKLRKIVLQVIKDQYSFEQNVEKFLNSKQQKYLIIQMKRKDLSTIQYLISQIQKVIVRQEVSKQMKFNNKNIYLLYEFDRKDQTQSQQETKKGISFLCQYRQIFYEGKLELGTFKYTKEEFFENILDLSHVMNHVYEFFTVDLKCKNQDNKPHLLKAFKNVYNELKDDKNDLFHRHLQDFIQKTEGTNISINETLILQVLENPQFLQNSKNFKEALTRQLSKKSFNGVVAFFIKYLFESQSFMTYSNKQIHSLNSIELFILSEERKVFIEKVKNSQVYKSILKFIIGRKISYLSSKYRDAKNQRRLPSLQRQSNIQIQRARYLHFSKSENEMILSKDVGSLSELANRIIKSSNIEKQIKTFRQQLYKKSNYVIKNDMDNNKIEENLYTSMNKDDKIKELFLFQLLIDFIEKKGINLKHIELFMKIVKIFVNFNSSQDKKGLDLESTILVILSFESVLTFVFKLFSVLFDAEVYIIPHQSFFKDKIITQAKHISEKTCSLLIQMLIEQFFVDKFTNYHYVNHFGGPKQFYEIFTNSMTQMENLQKIVKGIRIPAILISLRDVSRFITEFNQQHRYQLLQKYVRTLNQVQNPKDINVYAITFDFVESLYKPTLSTGEKQIIMKFQANKIFLQWFNDKPDDQNCLNYFIKKCEQDNYFCHNTMHVINYLFSIKKFSYHSVNEIEAQMRQAQKELNEIAKYSKAHGFKNNLCILMVNIFLQKLIKENKNKQHKQILTENKAKFINYFKSLSSNDMNLELFQIFLFAYVKFVLISYSELFLSDDIDNEISEILNLDNDLSKNSRLFCLKILRKYLTPKQIKQKFISIKRMHWSAKVEPDFKENQERSLIVPKDFCSQQLASVLQQLQLSDGAAFDLFEKLLQHATTFENRYSILNFFMRFYYSLSYNEKTYRTKSIDHFKSLIGKFSQKMGKVESELMLRYLNNDVSQHFCVKSSSTVNEDDFIVLNFMNLFLASKGSISPLHSLFFKDGQFAEDIFELSKDQFVISGAQNPFINIAESVIELTRNNNIGVYICCSECDYIYSHENCGWPNQQVDCPMCGEKIGCKDRGHTLSRDDKGARRVMSKVFVDKSVFYVWSMTTLTEFWEIQRKYIQAQIYRMKQKKEVTIKIQKQLIKLTGLDLVNSGRISSFSFKFISSFFDIINYLLVSLQVVKQNQVQKLYGVKTSKQALNKFNVSLKKGVNQIKASLNLGNKFYGWVYGIERNFIISLNDFPNKFTAYQTGLKNEMVKLKGQLNERIQEKKIKQDYINLYIDFVKSIDQGYFIKDVEQIKDYTANNRFTRDFAEKMFEDLIRTYSGDKKFDFSQAYQMMQGKMQFPFDSFLTQDEQDEKNYAYMRIFKLPDQQISHSEIVVKYEAFIKEKYPYLDYVLKQSDQFAQMENFYKLISFVNQLHKQVNNRYQRTKGQQPLEEFIQELKYDTKLSKTLQKPEQVITSWNQLSKFLGVLQNECKVIGRMNDQNNLQTQLKAFLLDQSTKQNPYGLMVASIFHNFAKIHNQSMAILNSRKNQIKAYRNLNLFNDLLRVHPQQIQKENIFIIEQSELKDQLESCSVSSIIYGQNFIFHNFDAYQEYFLNKLEGKCEIISNLKEYISVCYNGEAFSAQTEGSAVLAEIREILDRKLSEKSLRAVKEFVSLNRNSQNFEKDIIQLRGDLEKIMLMLHTLKGNYSKQQTLSQIQIEIQIKAKSQQLRIGDISQIPVCEIFDLYEFLQTQLKYSVLKRLPERYKEKIDAASSSEIFNFFNELPRQNSDEYPTVEELQSAIFKFASRTLQNGIFDGQKKLIEFVASRADFWPKDYAEEKKFSLMYNQTLTQIQMAHTMAVIEMFQKIKTDRKDQ